MNERVIGHFQPLYTFNFNFTVCYLGLIRIQLDRVANSNHVISIVFDSVYHRKSLIFLVFITFACECAMFDMGVVENDQANTRTKSLQQFQPRRVIFQFS